MKKILTAFVLVTSFTAFGQNKSTEKKPVTKTPVKSTGIQSGGVLKTLNDSASYAIGISVANFYEQQGLKNINADIVAKAIKDVLQGKKSLLSDQQANAVMMQCMQKAQAEKVGPNVAAGEKFLAENKSKPGVHTTASGLQYEIIKQGEGAKPGPKDTVVAHYAGTLINGQEFDNSYKRGEPLTIGVSSVIAGWTEALQLMPVGSKYKLYIPYQLGYGLNDQGPAIPAGSVLVFEVELLDIKKAK
jgi:FKBP-type peptidyl-prolyl cis-trans isomerase FklB